MLPYGVTRDEVFQDLIFLSQLIDMNMSNATKFRRLRSVLDMNNITATVALQEVRTAHTLLHKRLPLSDNRCHAAVLRSIVLSIFVPLYLQA
jgi:hypothetical protein